MPEHGFTVAWVFVALAGADAPGPPDPGSLESVLGSADASNHAALSQDELEHGMRDLIHAGLATDSGGRLGLNQAGHLLFDEVWNQRGDFVIYAAEKRLKDIDCVAQTSTWSIGRDEYDRATDRYRALLIDSLRATYPDVAELLAKDEAKRLADKSSTDT
jgi:hypothetical protein